MKTKFVLHGGFKPGSRQEDTPFFEEILKSVKDSPKILLVYFAKELDRIPINKQEDIYQFENSKGDKKLSFEVANEESFPEQIKRSDIIYFHGGSTLKLLNTPKKFSNIKELFEGKIVAADSAGVNSISAFSYSQKADAVIEGIGFIPFKTICHYSEKYKDKIDELNKYDRDPEILLLQEYQYKVFQK